MKQTLVQRISSALVRHKEFLELGATAGEITGRLDTAIYNALPYEAKLYAEQHGRLCLDTGMKSDAAFVNGLVLGIALIRLMETAEDSKASDADNEIEMAMRMRKAAE